MFKKIRARINERRELEEKLEGLTDPTLLHRMYRTHLLNKNIAALGGK
jgi:hypothetical protein